MQNTTYIQHTDAVNKQASFAFSVFDIGKEKITISNWQEML